MHVLQYDWLLSHPGGNLPGPPLVGSTAAGTTTSITGSGKIPPVIREIVSTLDDKEWQSSLYGLLQNQTYNQCEVDLFELTCKVLDQNLFSQVDWARNSIYFKELKVSLREQMRCNCLEGEIPPARNP